MPAKNGVQRRDELHRKLVEKGKNSPDVLFALQRYFALCVLVEPAQTIHLCRDADDDFILDCAVEAGATLIITSDSDLLALSGHPAIKQIEIIDVQEARRRFITGIGTCNP